MTDAQDRDISTYSKGMKQRIKMATALVHDPPVLLLDEPFNGMDPRQRLQLMDLLQAMGDAGRTVLFSSHILEEVEQIAGNIQVMVAGRHAASGDFREIRRLMTERPHQYTIRSDDDRALAAAIIADRSASSVELIAAPTGGRQVSPGRADASAPGTATSALHVQATDFAQLRAGAAAARQPARHPAVRGLPRRRVARERLLLPGGAMNATVAQLTARSLLGRRRAYLLLALSLVLLVLSALVRGLAGQDTDITVGILGGFALATIVPLLGLIAGTGSIGPEIDDGSIVYLLSKPLSRFSIVLTKAVVAVGVITVFGALAVLAAGLVLSGTSDNLAVGYAVGALVAGIAYGTFFLLLAVLTRHAVVVGLLYALIWETLVGSYVPGAQTLSIQQWSLAITEKVVGSDAERARRHLGRRPRRRHPAAARRHRRVHLVRRVAAAHAAAHQRRVVRLTPMAASPDQRAGACRRGLGRISSGRVSDPGRGVRRRGERRSEVAAGTRESWDDAVPDLVR